MRRYELMLLFRPDLEDDKLQSAVEKVTRAIVNAGGALTKVSPWGKRRLAYEIQHFREASYFLLHFDIAPSQIREIERGMLISEEILRHMVTVLEDRGEMSDEDLPAAVPAARGEDEDEDEDGDGGRAGQEGDDEGPSRTRSDASGDQSGADDADGASDASDESDGSDESGEAADSVETDADADADAEADEPRDAEPVEA